MTGSPFEKQYTDEDCLGALREFGEREGRAPTTHEWGKLRMRPGVTAILSRFPSWTAAVQRAGMTPLGSGSTTGARLSKDEDTKALIERVRNGESVLAIALERGVSSRTLSQRIKRYVDKHNLDPVGGIGGGPPGDYAGREERQLNDPAR